MTVSEKKIVSVNLREARLKRKIREHLQSLGFTKTKEGNLRPPGNTKEAIRSLHHAQREERLMASQKFLSRAGGLINYFASGEEIDPEKISPVLERVTAGTKMGDLFRVASLSWSIPVSNGFGRRLRYLVWDESNGKLMGIIAIGDPVFNLSVRDQLIGWDTNDRSSRLVNIMDAYVLGAVPPYNSLLVGKLVACLLRSREIYNDFLNAYGDRAGVISKEEKKPRLLAITTSSSMGRSSVYNRLKLNGVQYLKPIGYTSGWGHFHIPDKLFVELRNYLRDIDHVYADQYSFGQGPNWRLRTIKAALTKLGFRESLMRHGIKREVFICCLADNSISVLKTGEGLPDISSMLTVKEISESALHRWVIPRSRNRHEYRAWKTNNFTNLLGCQEKNVLAQIEIEGDKYKGRRS